MNSETNSNAKSKRGLLTILVILVVIIALAAVFYGTLTEDEDAGLPVNMTRLLEALPAFTVYDAEGNAVEAADFTGKPTVINCWTSWCGPCQSEMPHFNEVYLEYADEVQFAMINMTSDTSETYEAATAYIEDGGFEFPVYFDTEALAAINLSVRSLPTTFFVNADGEIMVQARGAISKDALIKGIEIITEK